MCVYMGVWVCVWACLSVCECVCIWVCVCEFVCVHVWVYVNVCVYGCVSISGCRLSLLNVTHKVFMHGESKLYTVNLHMLSRSTIGVKNLGWHWSHQAYKGRSWINWTRALNWIVDSVILCWIINYCFSSCYLLVPDLMASFWGKWLLGLFLKCVSM